MEVEAVRTKEKKDDGRTINLFAPTWPFRALFSGSSGSGKTSALFALLKNIEFDYCFFHTKYIEDDDFMAMREYFEKREQEVYEAEQKKKKSNKKEEKVDPIDKLVNKAPQGFKTAAQKEKQSDDEDDGPVQRVFWSNTLADVIDPVTLEQPEDSKNDNSKKVRYMYVFDDMQSESKGDKSIVDLIYTTGRHNYVSVIMLTQTLTGASRAVRGNSTNVGLFGYNSTALNNDYLKEIHQSCGSMIDKEKDFIDLYKICIKRPYGFLWLEPGAKDVYRRIRFKYDSFYNPIKGFKDTTPASSIPPMFVKCKNEKDIVRVLAMLKRENRDDSPTVISGYGAERRFSGSGADQGKGLDLDDEDKFEVDFTDINDLHDKFKLALGLIAAGNNNPNVIKVAKDIANELLKRGAISRLQYNKFSKIFRGTFE